MTTPNTKVYQMPTDPTSVADIWKPTKGCDAVPPPTIGNLFETAGSLAEKQGANEKCKKYSDMSTYNQSAEGGASAGLFGGSLLGGSIAFKEQATLTMNIAAQEGCGTILTTANNVLQTNQQLQCVINNSMTSTTSVANMSNVVTIIGQPLTPSQDANLATLLTSQNTKLAASNAQASKDWITLLTTPGITSDKLAYFQTFQNNAITLMKAAFADQTALYTRNISLNETKILQSISGSIKTECKLSNDDATTIANISTSIAKDVAAQSIAATMGVSAQDPNLKQAVSNNKQISDNLTAEKINTLVSQAQSSLSVSNGITITTAGNINLNDVTFDQNIVVSLITSAIMNSAISTGLQAAASMTTDTQSVQAIATTVKGLEDYIKEIGNIGDISTPPPAPAGSTSSTIGLYIFLIILCIVGAGGAYLYYTQGPGMAGSGSGSGLKSAFRFHRTI